MSAVGCFSLRSYTSTSILTNQRLLLSSYLMMFVVSRLLKYSVEEGIMIKGLRILAMHEAQK